MAEEKIEQTQLNDNEQNQTVEYIEDNIIHLSDMDHVRTRPGMYIGRLGDGSHAEDGIYVLLKEIIDNSIDEFKMNAGKRIEVDITDDRKVTVRDYGRGIPQGKMIDAVSILNTGGKYDSKAFKKSVGLNGVGSKAVNALSTEFRVASYRDGKVRKATFQKGLLQTDVTEDSDEETGTLIYFEPDDTLFLNYKYQPEFVETMLRNYTYLNTGLEIYYNGRRIISRNGLKDLLTDTMDTTPLYPIIHLKGDDIEIAFTHTNQQYGEEYHSFVNGQHTIQGGTHQSAFKEHIARTIKEFFNKNYEFPDIRSGIVAAIAINVEEPQFESQTKIKLGSLTMEPNGGVSVNKFVGDFIKTEVDNYLHKNPDIAEIIEQKVKELGGLCIVGTERHESRRIDNQLRGRSGRQGDPGNTQFFIALEDDLMRLFSGERMQNVLARVGMDEDEPLEAGMLSRSIEGAQKKVEGKNFGIRKYVLQYDNVMNKQREIIYDQRRMVLDGEDVSGYIKNMTYELIDGIIDPVVMESKYSEEWDIKRITDGLEQITPAFRGRFEPDEEYLRGLSEEQLKDDIKQIFDEMYEEKEAEIGSEQMREVERMILLRVVDNRWMDHIDAMDQLKDGIGLRGIGQQDPAVAYAQEGFAMFDEMVADIREETVKFCYNVTVTTKTERRNVVTGKTSAAKEEYKDDSAAPAKSAGGSMPAAAPKADKTGKQETVRRDMPKVGRNDPCPCGSGKKYKNCCGRNA